MLIETRTIPLLGDKNRTTLEIRDKRDYIHPPRKTGTPQRSVYTRIVMSFTCGRCLRTTLIRWGPVDRVCRVGVSRRLLWTSDKKDVKRRESVRRHLRSVERGMWRSRWRSWDSPTGDTLNGDRRDTGPLKDVSHLTSSEVNKG